ncbi:MAG TPA: chromosome segregation protein SMC [Saprospiraceae bacterium]|nr:chromosome segregation protein SMC [Saprospiraceae bacterium]
MRLKSLEIKGFKSFADDTVIHFNEEITGIVGPNGSGKSNIVDAIRWVLGEQKGRELRLAQMADVIFNGTKKRKAAPMAQVTLNFENTKNILPTDYQDISISRLLYRSGESEYRLNGVNCRLKDITSLFLDTGVGPDSYAIIALGMVEDILSNKENARRKMFEQAAGISKYKARKKESIQKLKATNEDLARIEDLLFEINNNLTDLEKQAKRAKKYFEMRDKYRSTAMLLYHISVNNLREKINSISDQINQKLDLHREQEIIVRNTEAELEQFKKSNLDKEKNLGDFQKKVNLILDEIRTAEGDVQVKDQKRNLLESQILQIAQQIETAGVRLQSLELEIVQRLQEADDSAVEYQKASHQSLTQEQIYIEKQTEFDDLKAGVDIFNQEKSLNEKAIFDLEKTIAIAENQIENIQVENQRLENELELKVKEFSHFEIQKIEKDQSLVVVRQKITECLREEEIRQEKIKNLQKEIESQNSKIGQLNRSKDAKKNEFELLKSMVEKMEGFPESIRFLHQNWRKDIPVLSDLIYTAEKYRNAIEMFLEPYLNYYVVHTEDEALKAIKLLMSSGKGKAHFFILDKFRQIHKTQADIKNCKKASDLVEVDELYQPLFNSLLNNVYIPDDDKQLDDVIRFPDEISVVSVSGSILKKSEAISGGSVGLFEGKKLGRKKNLEKLEKEIKDLELEILSLDRNLVDVKNDLKKLELDHRNSDLLDLRKSETELVAAQAQLQTKLQHFIEFKESVSARLLKNKSQAADLKNQIQNQNSDLGLARNKYDLLLQSIADKDDVFGKVSAELSHVLNEFNQSKIEVLKWQNRHETNKRELGFRQQQKEEITGKNNEDEQKITNYRNEVAELKSSLTAARELLRERFEAKKILESDLSSLEKEYYEARNEITIYENKIKAAQKASNDLQSDINALKDNRSEASYKIQSTEEKTEIEFSMKLSEFVPDQETIDMDEDQLRDRSLYYKVRLDNYGEINPLALEAYEEMKERHDKIQEQRTDILQAQEKLLETIKEIENTATAGFMLAFNQVRTHFQDVFRSLFTADDDCDLILLDQNDPLECDIDIIAKPKGKRPKSIHQLSGGEKTLTAIALLFSLYLLKPAPFCIFDEVDAPLDDINIEKFNHIIRKFSKSSQFIIITHNKLTMAEVDVLYGVYMEEQGISGVTSVDFRKYDHEIVLEEMER